MRRRCAVLVAVLAACGGDDNAPADGTTAVPVTLTVTIKPNGAGVTSDPAGISCAVADSPCTATFPMGTTVKLVYPGKTSTCTFVACQIVGGGLCSGFVMDADKQANVECFMGP